MTMAQLRARRSVLVNELSRLSKNGWRDAKPCDYVPLEAELRQIEPLIKRRTR